LQNDFNSSIFGFPLIHYGNANMSNKVYFMNNGTFDLRGMLTMGLSAKTREDAIGFFGTGFKYAVAIILRALGTIKITTKGEDGSYYIYEFVTKRENFRGQEIDFIYIRDHATGELINSNFTTRMGINWRDWMAFRELYCNCMDESGTVSAEYIDGFDTVIDVDCSGIAEAFQDRDNYILPKMEPIHSDDKVDIYDVVLPYIYYRGIAVLKFEGAAFTYNIKQRIDLTEDRTVAYEWYVRDIIRDAIQRTESETIIEKMVLETQDKCKEQSLTLDSGQQVSDKFLEVCERLRNTDRGITGNAQSLVKAINYKKNVFDEFELNEVQEKMVFRAKAFLMAMDIPVDQFPIKFVLGLGQGCMGRASGGISYISEIPFQLGTKQLASTLLEEWVHLKTGCHDFDRQMQNWLFDKILSLGENINGEPL